MPKGEFIGIVFMAGVVVINDKHYYWQSILKQ
jgi:hypothetical protein